MIRHPTIAIVTYVKDDFTYIAFDNHMCYWWPFLNVSSFRKISLSGRHLWRYGSGQKKLTLCNRFVIILYVIKRPLFQAFYDTNYVHSHVSTLLVNATTYNKSHVISSRSMLFLTQLLASTAKGFVVYASSYAYTLELNVQQLSLNATYITCNALIYS